ncbi:adhesion regulating molecule [Calocera viscosa TUFC12733]|uniref:Adhesion regulating molecule n=1 Tax=Calocera viscosa (strain TUFC12733) TaxID=1330018 RepID=A0A167MS43_CALVF|nr:adhesion regulating molecule [Calocera viscosa TUFC12733]
MLSFKAGRCNRRGETNWVDPTPTKGLITLETSAEDGLLHFSWKNRETGATDEDLILFPSEANFLKVDNVTGGRVYVLKFSSSDQRYFFWMQNADTGRDEYYAHNVNGLLDDPSFSPAEPPAAPAPVASTSAAPEPAAPSGSSQPSMEEQLRQLRELVQSATATAGTAAGPELTLTDVITPQSLEPLFARPDLLLAIFPNLPADLPGERNADTIREVIQSSAFKASLRGLQQALNTGLLSNLVISLGLPPEAGTGVGPFLRAISEQAQSSSTENPEGGDEHMETD